MSTFEEQLPEVDENTRNAVVIISLGARTDLGSTCLGILERYADDLRAHDRKLMLAGLSATAKGLLEHAGQIGACARDNVFVATEVAGESILEACHAAENGVARGAAEEKEAEVAKEEETEPETAEEENAEEP